MSPRVRAFLQAALGRGAILFGKLQLRDAALRPRDVRANRCFEQMGVCAVIGPSRCNE